MKAVSLKARQPFLVFFFAPKLQSTFASEKFREYEIRRNNI